jgi:hypothetical protein
MNLTPSLVYRLLHNLNAYLPCTPYATLSDLTTAIVGSEAGGRWLLWFWARQLQVEPLPQPSPEYRGGSETIIVPLCRIPSDLDRSNEISYLLERIGLTHIRHNLRGSIELSFRLKREAFMPVLARVLGLSIHQATMLLQDSRQMERESYYLSPQWAARRWLVIQRAGACCEKCHRKTARLQVHHLNYQHLGNEPLDDLKALCGKCHQAAHNHTDKQRPPGKAVARTWRVNP